MDDTPPATATATATAPPADGPYNSEPSAARRAELRAAYDANVAAGKMPYKQVVIRTLGELTWILRERDWSTDPSTVLDGGKERANLSSAIIKGTNLNGAKLSWANLSNASLASADLRGADLYGADLSNAMLPDADLSGAILFMATLSGTTFSRADLIGASLVGANLRGARLQVANLRGADLREAQLDATTQLAQAILDDRTCLLDIDWQGVPLTRVASWPQRLGDEQDIGAARDRKERLAAYRDATRSYRNLNVALRSQGLLIPASNYRLREQVLERKALFLDRKPLAWVFSWLLFLVAGYGERPARSLVAYLLVLFGFASAYLALGSGTHDAIHTPLAALVFSVTSFHGRGFFPGGLALDDPITVLAAIEAVIGLFIEITFIATFTQRFFGSR